MSFTGIIARSATYRGERFISNFAVNKYCALHFYSYRETYPLEKDLRKPVTVIDSHVHEVAWRVLNHGNVRQLADFPLGHERRMTIVEYSEQAHQLLCEFFKPQTQSDCRLLHALREETFFEGFELCGYEYDLTRGVQIYGDRKLINHKVSQPIDYKRQIQIGTDDRISVDTRKAIPRINRTACALLSDSSYTAFRQISRTALVARTYIQK